MEKMPQPIAAKPPGRSLRESRKPADAARLEKINKSLLRVEDAAPSIEPAADAARLAHINQMLERISARVDESSELLMKDWSPILRGEGPTIESVSSPEWLEHIRASQKNIYRLLGDMPRPLPPGFEAIFRTGK